MFTLSWRGAMTGRAPSPAIGGHREEPFPGGGTTPAPPGDDALRPALIASGCVLLLTMIHHVHGAIVYSTPWRLEVAYIVVPTFLALVLTRALAVRSHGTRTRAVARWTFGSLVVLVPFFLFGVVEGGYNHVLKNILYFGGAGGDTLKRLFPPATHELPSDVWFEATGVLQFFAGLIALRALLRGVRRRDLRRSTT